MKIKKILSFAAVVLFASVLTSCVKTEVDDPPANGTDPGITANKTIAQIKSLYVSGAVTQITGDFVFKAVVVADDRSGNIYKSIVLQDSTAGISIVLDQSNYYTSYETGRNVYVMCKGLYIGDYNGLIQLGGYNDAGQVGRIPASLVGQHLIGGMWNQSYTTEVIYDFNNLDNTQDQNKIFKLSGVKFDTPCETWANMSSQTTGDRDLKDAYGHTIVVRTSNFATFASGLIPGSTGDVIGVFQIYRSTKQFVIRDLNDVLMAPASCGPPPGPTMTINALRALYTGVPGTIPAGTVIKGVVISDKSNSNITSRNMVMQDATGGILVRFTGNNVFSMGDEVLVDVSGQAISEYAMLLQAENVPNSNAFLVNTGVAVTPRIATIADVNANGEAWESTLVTIMAGTISGTGTYSGNQTITDATGTLALYTTSYASFAAVSYPVTPVNITGIVSQFNTTRQFNIRNTGDVQ